MGEGRGDWRDGRSVSRCLGVVNSSERQVMIWVNALILIPFVLIGRRFGCRKSHKTRQSAAKLLLLLSLYSLVLIIVRRLRVSTWLFPAKYHRSTISRASWIAGGLSTKQSDEITSLPSVATSLISKCLLCPYMVFSTLVTLVPSMLEQ